MNENIHNLRIQRDLQSRIKVWFKKKGFNIYKKIISTKPTLETTTPPPPKKKPHQVQDFSISKQMTYS